MKLVLPIFTFPSYKLLFSFFHLVLFIRFSHPVVLYRQMELVDPFKWTFSLFFPTTNKAIVDILIRIKHVILRGVSIYEWNCWLIGSVSLELCQMPQDFPKWS